MKRMLVRALLALWLSILSAGSWAQTLKEVRSVEGITEYALPNGLQLLLVPDDSKPTTTVNLTVRVGSRHESYGETGMAHLLEHLVFKGSKRHPNAWSEFTRRGLRSNGTTWFDRTNYFASFSANDDNLSWIIDWLGDALVNSFIARKDLDTEMTVVRNEMEMGENNPEGILFQKTLAAMYQWHNYGKDTIGARSDVEGVDIERLQAFYRLWYQPDNATLTVSGRFDAARVRGLVEQHFGPIPRPQRVLPILYTLDPVQDGEREVTVRRVGGAPAVMATYHSVAGSHPDHAAAELLALILGESPAGRLHKRLTEKGLAAGTWGWSISLHDPGFIAFGAQLSPGQDPEPARKALLSTLESVATEPITEEEVQRAKARWLKGWERSFSDPERVGVGLSESVALGDWRLAFLARDRVRGVRLEAVQRFAVERLLPSNRTLGVFIPTDKPARPPAPAKVDVAEQLRSFVPQGAMAKAEAFDVSPANIDARTERGRVGGVKYALLPKRTRNAVVSAVLRLRLGDEASLRGSAHVGAMMASLLDKGGAGLGRQQIQDRLDLLRSELRFSYSRGVLEMVLESRREHLPQALELAVSLLRRPAFEAATLDELKRQAIAANEQARQEPADIAGNELARHGNPHPPGHPLYVTTFAEEEREIRAVTLDAVRQFHSSRLGAGTAEFAAVGDFDAAAVKAALAASLAPWSSPSAYARVADPLWAGAPKRMQFPAPDKQNASLQVRLPVPMTQDDAQAPALILANMILGGGGNSRLWTRVREKEGLSYDVGSTIDWNPRDPHAVWQVWAIFAPANLAKVELALQQEIERALTSGFTEAELKDAKSGILNLRSLQRAQDASLARRLASDLDLGRTLAWSARLDQALERTTLEEVNAALRRHIRPERFVTAVAGDFPAR